MRRAFFETDVWDDEDVVLRVAINDPLSLQYASDRLRNDRDFILEVCQECRRSEILKYIDKSFRDDAEIVKAAIEVDPDNFEYASDRIRGDPDIVHHVLRIDGNYLQYASDELQDDEKTVRLAFSDSCRSFRFASDRIKGDFEILGSLISVFPEILEYASGNVRDDKDMMIHALLNCDSFDILQFASPRLLKDRDFMLEVVEHPKPFRDFPRYWLDNYDFMLEAIKINPDIAKETHPKLLRDRDYTLECAKFMNIFDIIWSNRNDREIVIATIKFDINDGLWSASDRLKNDREIVSLAVSLNGRALNFASERLKDDFSIVKEAVSNDKAAISFASGRLRKNKSIIRAAFRKNPTDSAFSGNVPKSNMEEYWKLMLVEDLQALVMSNPPDLSFKFI